MSRLCSIAKLILAAWLVGCASTPLGKQDLLAFLQPDLTTRREIAQKLGPPDATYEQGRIVTYWIRVDNGGYYRPPPSLAEGSDFSLVLVFRGDDVLSRQSLVKVH